MFHGYTVHINVEGSWDGLQLAGLLCPVEMPFSESSSTEPALKQMD